MATIILQIEQEDKEIIKKAAATEDRQVSNYVRYHILKIANQTLLKKVYEDHANNEQEEKDNESN